MLTSFHVSRLTFHGSWERAEHDTDGCGLFAAVEWSMSDRLLGHDSSKNPEFSAEWMVNKEKQAVRKLSEAVHVTGWKRFVKPGAHQGLFHNKPWWP